MGKVSYALLFNVKVIFSFNTLSEYTVYTYTVYEVYTSESDFAGRFCALSNDFS